MKPIHELEPEQLDDLLFYTSDNGTKIAISKITSITTNLVTLGNDKYKIDQATYNILMDKLTTYEGVKLMYAQEDLSKQVSKITKEDLAAQFSEYFEHMDDIVDHIETQAKRVVSNLQSTVDTVSAKAKDTLVNIDSINVSIKPFKQFAESTNLADLKSTIKANVEQFAPIKADISEVLADLKTLFAGK
jgi:hypothetical protein